MNRERIAEIEESYTNVNHVGGLDVFAIEGKGLYVGSEDGTVWQVANERYIAVTPKLQAQYPYDVSEDI